MTPSNLKSISREIHVFFLALLLIGVVMIFLLPTISYIPVFLNDAIDLPIVETLFVCFSIICVLFGCFLPALTSRFRLTDDPDMRVLWIHLLRTSFFGSIVAFGLILVLLGSSWYISISFFALSGAVLILTFPTEKRWRRWKMLWRHL